MNLSAFRILFFGFTRTHTQARFEHKAAPKSPASMESLSAIRGPLLPFFCCYFKQVCLISKPKSGFKRNYKANSDVKQSVSARKKRSMWFLTVGTNLNIPGIRTIPILFRTCVTMSFTEQTMSSQANFHSINGFIEAHQEQIESYRLRYCLIGLRWWSIMGQCSSGWHHIDSLACKLSFRPLRWTCSSVYKETAQI